MASPDYATYSSANTREIKADKLEPVAIIGFSLKFPQDAVTADAFWQMLCEARSAMTEVPQDRFNIDAFYHANSDRLDCVCIWAANPFQYILAFDIRIIADTYNS